eukprot:8108342-Pyramimonas_sp.AAC.1
MSASLAASCWVRATRATTTERTARNSRTFSAPRVRLHLPCDTRLFVARVMGRENIPATGTNRSRGERIYPYRTPIAEGESEYTRSRHQLQ